jgi:hypothetical protein
MPVPLRGTQSLVGQMGWVFARPSLTAIEIAWRWTLALPFMIVILLESIKILIALPPETTGLSTIDLQNPWVAATQLNNIWALYQPRCAAVLQWLLPVASLTWVIVSGLGRSIVLRRILSLSEKIGDMGEVVENRSAEAKAQYLFCRTFGTTEVVPFYKAGKLSSDSALRLRPLSMIALQAAWLAGFALTCWTWFRSMQWVAATHITPNAEPDLIGFSVWAIFLSLGFFTVWALTSWALSVAPLVMLLEERSAFSALVRSFHLGRPMTAKLVEINMVMGIVNLALIVLAMVLSAAPLPFSDQLGPETLHVVWMAAGIFYLVASDYFQVVRLKGFLEFWKLECSPQAEAPAAR